MRNFVSVMLAAVLLAALLLPAGGCGAQELHQDQVAGILYLFQMIAIILLVLSKRTGSRLIHLAAPLTKPQSFG